jgi:hypothetical protein
VLVHRLGKFGRQEVGVFAATVVMTWCSGLVSFNDRFAEPAANTHEPLSSAERNATRNVHDSDGELLLQISICQETTAM